MQCPVRIYPQEKRSGTRCTGGWMGLRAGLDGCGKSRPQPPGFDPTTVHPVAIRYIDYAILAHNNFSFVSFWRDTPPSRVSSFTRFLDHTQRRTTVGRTPLDEWSASRRELYLTTHNAHNRQTSMPPAGFEPTISAGERPQNYALDRAATGTGW